MNCIGKPGEKVVKGESCRAFAFRGLAWWCDKFDKEIPRGSDFNCKHRVDIDKKDPMVVSS